MTKMIKLLSLLVPVAVLCVMLTACGGGGESVDYEHQRKLSWEGTELTIKLGENQSTGCEWDTKPQDDSVIDYSVNRKFKLAGKGLAEGEAIGTLEAGFQGKGAGTSQIICTTPVDWDGTGDGYTYIVTVTVNEDGTIESATGEESDTKPAEETEEPQEAEQASATLEDYFKEHQGELEDIKKGINSDDSIKDLMEVDIKVDGNTLIYIYTFKETYSADRVEAMKPELEKSFTSEDTEASMKESISKVESEYGISGAKMKMEYRNGDGETICSGTFE